MSATDPGRATVPAEARNNSDLDGCQRNASFGFVLVPKSL